MTLGRLPLLKHKKGLESKANLTLAWAAALQLLLTQKKLQQEKKEKEKKSKIADIIDDGINSPIRRKVRGW